MALARASYIMDWISKNWGIMNHMLVYIVENYFLFF